MIHQAVREASAVSGDTAATLQARLEALEGDLRTQSEKMRTAAKDARRLLAEARVESSEARLNQAGVPGCGAQLRTEITFRRSQAHEWMRQGQARTNPKATLEDLRHALALDAELPGLGAAIDVAERRKAALAVRRLPGCAQDPDHCCCSSSRRGGILLRLPRLRTVRTDSRFPLASKGEKT
jgi:hypothetical protein